MAIMDDFIIRNANNGDGERVRELVFAALYEFGMTPDPGGSDSDIMDIEANYTSRGGIFEVIEDRAGRLLGTAALYPMDEETIELRKMYFAPEFRGRGYGKQMLARMVDTARALGYRRIYLETAAVLETAVHLYTRFGFREARERHTPRCDRAFVFELE